MGWARHTGTAELPSLPPGWTEEHRLLASAVLWSVNGIEDRSRGLIHWDRFAELVVRHGVYGVLDSDLLLRLGVPGSVAASLRSAKVSSGASALARIAVLTELVQAFQAAGLSFAVLKGLPLAQLAYGHPYARASGDIDVLVPPNQLGHAVRLLDGMGFTFTPAHPWAPDSLSDLAHALGRGNHLPALYEVAFARHGVVVDLHWRLSQNRALLPPARAWFDEPLMIRVGRATVPTLPWPEAWWSLLVHGTKHRWCRLLWLTDLVALWARRPDLPDATYNSSSRGLERYAAVGILTAQAVFGSPIDDAVVQWAMGQPGAVGMAGRCLVQLATALEPSGVHRSPAELVTEAWERTRLCPRTRAFLAEEVRVWATLAGRDEYRFDASFVSRATGPARWATRRLLVSHRP